jgi:hypothetical protein
MFKKLIHLFFKNVYRNQKLFTFICTLILLVPDKNVSSEIYAAKQTIIQSANDENSAELNYLILK